MSVEDYELASDSISIREFKTGGKIMVTTMSCPIYATKDELRQLYKSRWHVELDIRHIKDTMGMGILSCKTPEMAIREMWVYFLAYNLIRFLMMKSALLADICPRTISFKHCMQLWSSWNQQFTKMDQEKNQIIFMLIAKQTVGKRPGRMEPRAVKRRAKPYPKLKQHRRLARAEVLKNGHS